MEIESVGANERVVWRSFWACINQKWPMKYSSWASSQGVISGLQEELWKHAKKETHTETYLVAQWLRPCPPIQGTWVRAVVWDDPTYCGATKPVRHDYWACALESTSHNYWACAPQLLSLRSRAHEPQLLSPHATTTEACVPRAHAPQQEKPPEWEAHAPQQRVAPARHN